MDVLVAELGKELDDRDDRLNVILAALAELGARYLTDGETVDRPALQAGP